MDSSVVLVDSSKLFVDSSVVLVDSSTFLPKGSLQGSLVWERDLTGVVRFSASRQLVSELRQLSDDAGDDDGLQGLSAMMDTARRRDNTIKKMSLKVNN